MEENTLQALAAIATIGCFVIDAASLLSGIVKGRKARKRMARKEVDRNDGASGNK